MAVFKWTPRREQFCVEFIVDLNATQAAIRAGYAAKNAEKEACRLMALPEIQERISEQKAERSERTKIDADYVLNQAVKLHERCMQEISPKTDRKGEPIRDEEGNQVFEFNASGAAKALEMVGKHVDVQAFQEKVEHNVGRSLAELLAEAADE